jgi:riboflavin biosynthesis pyrimidine reductase
LLKPSDRDDSAGGENDHWPWQLRSSVNTIAAFSDRKRREAECAALTPLTTIEDCATGAGWIGIGNSWSRQLYDGPFYISPDADLEHAPLVSLVFVQSSDGNTGGDNPGALGGGPVDQHLIYEGLSRVAADAVMAGGKTAAGEEVFFSVWHPQLIALRAELGLARHPAQIVVTPSGRVDLERSLLYNVPDVPVYVLTSPDACTRLQHAAARRPNVELVPMSGTDLRPGLEYLRTACGIRRISAIGGRMTASALIDEALVQDLTLTTSVRSGGEPGTPFYVGKSAPSLNPIVRKRGTDPAYPIVVEQLWLRSQD